MPRSNKENMKQAKEFLETIIKGIVYNDSAVRVEADKDELGVLLRVWVHKDEMGLVIGRGGTTVSAIKLITRLYGVCHKMRINVRVEEPK